jgi:HEAT repeat protein
VRDRLSPELLPVIEPFLRDGDPMMRSLALEYYAELSPADATQRIVGALSDDDENVRYEALRALRDRLSPQLLPVIEPFLSDRDLYTRDLALEYQAELSPPDAP